MLGLGVVKASDRSTSMSGYKQRGVKVPGVGDPANDRGSTSRAVLTACFYCWRIDVDLFIVANKLSAVPVISSDSYTGRWAEVTVTQGSRFPTAS